MRFLHIFPLTGLLLTMSLHGQQLSVSAALVELDTVLTNTRDSLSFHIRNSGPAGVQVTNIRTYRPVFTVRDTAFLIPATDSVRVWVYFETKHNVTWQDVLLVEAQGENGTLPLVLRGTARYPDAAYNSTQGLWENDLKTALNALISPHTVLGYNTARNRMFETIDDPFNIDTIECVYTGRRIRAANRFEAQAQEFNTEHTWPQSTFNSQDPMQSDIHHLFPTDSTANGIRSNLRMAPVVSNITWSVGGSKRGFSPNGLLSFEPRDEHKGDAARVFFYFMIRYQNNYGNHLDVFTEFYLRQWHAQFPVSTKEIMRNDAIASFQGNRNPFVDHPEFVERISIFRVLTPPALSPAIRVAPGSIGFGDVAHLDSSEYRLTIVNTGRAPLSISTITFQSPAPGFVLVDNATVVPADTFTQIRIRFVPDAPNQSYSNTLVVQSNDPAQGTLNIPLTGSSTNPLTVGENDLPHGFALYQNYPNPFNPSTRIRYSVWGPGSSASSVESFVSLKVYDLLGREVATLVNEPQSTGSYTVTWDASGVSSGVYISRLTTPGGTLTKRMILLK
jgi:endonuclease I